MADLHLIISSQRLDFLGKDRQSSRAMMNHLHRQDCASPIVGDPLCKGQDEAVLSWPIEWQQFEGSASIAPSYLMIRVSSFDRTELPGDLRCSARLASFFCKVIQDRHEFQGARSPPQILCPFF